MKKTKARQGIIKAFNATSVKQKGNMIIFE